MPNLEAYKSGKEKAVIDPSNISDAWRPALQQEWLKILTFSFDLYFNARNNLEKCADIKRRQAMKDDLESCAEDGCHKWMRGVLGLNEGFKHLAENRGRWTDPITLSITKWYHEQDWSVFKTGWKNCHRAGVHFMEAFDKKTKEGVDALAKFQEEAAKLKRINGKCENLTGKEAKSAAETLKSIKEASEKVEKLLWLTARAEEIAEVVKVAGALKEFAETVEKCSKYAEFATKPLGKALSAADKVATGYDTYRRASDAGLGEGAALSLAFMQAAIEKVPVFGTLYATVLGGIPNTTEMVQNHANELKLAMLQLNLR